MDADTNSRDKTATETAVGQDIDNAVRHSETDLVDLWILFWDRRILFIVVTVLALVLGFAAFKIAYKPKQVATISSLVQTQEIPVGQIVAAYAYTAALARRTKMVELPRLASAEEFSAIRPYVLSTSVSEIQKSNLIEIVTHAPPGLTEEVSRFHQHLTVAMIDEINLTSRNLVDQTDAYFLSIRDDMDQVLALFYGLESQLQQTDTGVEQANTAAVGEVQAVLERIRLEFDNISEGIKMLRSGIMSLNPRALVTAKVVQRSVGVRAKLAYVVIVSFSLFLGIFVVVGSSFLAKVRQRKAARS